MKLILEEVEAIKLKDMSGQLSAQVSVGARTLVRLKKFLG